MDDLGAVEFGKVLGVTVSGNSRATTLQLAATGQEGDDDGAERIDAVEVLQPAGLMAAPSLSATAEAAFVRIGDQVIALAVIDKGAPSQAVEAGEVRLYGPGSQNATATVRIRADGSIEITSKSGLNVTATAPAAGVVILQNGSQAFVRGNDFSTALNTGIDAMKVLNVAVGTFATAVGVGTPLFPAVAAAAVVLNTAVGVCNTALDALKASSSTWLSTKVLGQ
jgi:hypothetical protein